jgi:hypothetical protein
MIAAQAMSNGVGAGFGGTGGYLEMNACKPDALAIGLNIIANL